MLENQLNQEEKLRYDYDILVKYKEAGLGCENVFKVKDIISKMNERISDK